MHLTSNDYYYALNNQCMMFIEAHITQCIYLSVQTSTGGVWPVLGTLFEHHMFTSELEELVVGEAKMLPEFDGQTAPSISYLVHL